MKEIVYVNGGVVILTPFFRYLDAGARFGMPSEVNNIIEPDEEIEGQPCIIITEKKLRHFLRDIMQKHFFQPSIASHLSLVLLLKTIFLILNIESKMLGI